MTRRLAATALFLLGSSLSAMAADAVTAPYNPAPAAPTPAKVDYAGADFVFELGVEGIYSPDYYGSNDYELTASPIFNVEYVNIPGLGSFGGPAGLGFSIAPSFVFQSDRDESDDRDLRGLDKIDATYELGGKVSYKWQNAEVYGAVRYAVGGANGFVGDFGANLIVYPLNRLEFKIGPTASLADSDYMDTYFGVSDRESINTGGRLSSYDADGGFKSVGARASAKYEVFTDYFVNADFKYDRLVGSASDSPIVKAGDENQYYFGLGISKRFSLDLF